MNLNGILPRNMYSLEVSQPHRFKDVVTGSKLAYGLREMAKTLRKNGYYTEGCIRGGFVASKGEEVITITITSLSGDDD